MWELQLAHEKVYEGERDMLDVTAAATPISCKLHAEREY